MEKKIEIEDKIREKCKEYAIVYMEADVENGPTSDSLKDEIARLADSISKEYKIEDINKRPGIATTRKAYKLFGKDPNRYRPSQEQLMRRIVRGLGLYTLTNLVDTGNLLSLSTGCSVGVFDRDKISGGVIRLGVGEENEPYEGIGRGVLNISGMPVLRDAEGGFGTPTSDHERTKTELETRRILVTLHIFDRSQYDIDQIASLMEDLFTKYCAAKNIKMRKEV